MQRVMYIFMLTAEYNSCIGYFTTCIMQFWSHACQFLETILLEVCLKSAFCESGLVALRISAIYLGGVLLL